MDKNFVCDVCGKDVSDPVRTTGLLCMEFGVHPKLDKQGQHVKRQYGPYKPGVYRICVECVLKTFGVTPNREEEDGKD